MAVVCFFLEVERDFKAINYEELYWCINCLKLKFDRLFINTSLKIQVIRLRVSRITRHIIKQQAGKLIIAVQFLLQA